VCVCVCASVRVCVWECVCVGVRVCAGSEQLQPGVSTYRRKSRHRKSHLVRGWGGGGWGEKDSVRVSGGGCTGCQDAGTPRTIEAEIIVIPTTS
jgi:hypothetical protein